MLIYTRRDDSDRRASAPIEPVPPPLASLRVEELDAEHDQAVKAFEKEYVLAAMLVYRRLTIRAHRDAVVIANFERLRDAKRSVYRAWDPSPDDTDSFLISKSQLRNWIETGITPIKPAGKEVDAAVDESNDATKNDSDSTETLELIVEPEREAATNSDVEMVCETAAGSPDPLSSSTILSNESIACPHGLLNPIKADQMKRIDFVSLSLLVCRPLADDRFLSSVSLLCAKSE